MIKQVFLFVCALATIQVSHAATVGDIIDEAYRQLEELKAIVEGQILLAHTEIHDIGFAFFTYSDQVVVDGEVALQQEHETIKAQVTTLKELALQANKDIRPCTDVREEVLDKLPQRFGAQLMYCVQGKMNETQRILDDAKFVVDVSTNKVHELEHQLRRCGEGEDSFLCIQPVLTEINLDMVRLPENIKTEIEATKAIVETLKSSVDQCSTVKVSEYSSDANSILVDITDCVNRILDN